MAVYAKHESTEDINKNKLLEEIERYNFTVFNLSQRRSNTRDYEFYSYAHDCYAKNKTIQKLINNIEAATEKWYDKKKFCDYIDDQYEKEGEGFSKWKGLRYFLYEHEQWLLNRGKQSKQKITWEKFEKSKKDFVTVEHIYPQNDKKWREHFRGFSKEQKMFLCHSLGNLLPLSKAKNSSLLNNSFAQKKDNGKGVGYYNGSASENEIAKKERWDAPAIYNRGMELLDFMEDRWNIKLGDKDFKTKLLHLEFIKNRDYQ